MINEEKETMELNEKEKALIDKVTGWVALTYGIEAIEQMATKEEGFLRFLEEYNDAMYAAYLKLKANKKAMAAFSELIYNEIRAEVSERDE